MPRSRFVVVDLDFDSCKTPPLEGLDFDGCRTPSTIYSLYTRLYVTLSEEHYKTSLYLKEELDKKQLLTLLLARLCS